MKLYWYVLLCVVPPEVFAESTHVLGCFVTGGSGLYMLVVHHRC